jgi:hypothetical protein
MELVTYFMIVLIALGACLGWPSLVNPPDSDGSNNSNGNSFDRVIFTNPDHPQMIKGKYEDGPGGPIGGSI